MRRLRTRKSIVFLCFALVVFAVFVTVVSTPFTAMLTPLWLVIPAAAVVVIRRTAVGCHDQPVSLLSLLLSRAPPAPFALV